MYSMRIGQLCGELELFNCRNNKCISEHLVCDGKSDCVDGRDEQKDLCLMIGKPAGPHYAHTYCNVEVYER